MTLLSPRRVLAGATMSHDFDAPALSTVFVLFCFLHLALKMSHFPLSVRATLSRRKGVRSHLLRFFCGLCDPINDSPTPLDSHLGLAKARALRRGSSLLPALSWFCAVGGAQVLHRARSGSDAIHYSMHERVRKMSFLVFNSLACQSYLLVSMVISLL